MPQPYQTVALGSRDAMDTASSAANAAGSAAKEVAKGLVNVLVYGSFNPEYSKEDQKRMRYIQQKYAQVRRATPPHHGACGLCG